MHAICGYMKYFNFHLWCSCKFANFRYLQNFLWGSHSPIKNFSSRTCVGTFRNKGRFARGSSTDGTLRGGGKNRDFYPPPFGRHKELFRRFFLKRFGFRNKTDRFFMMDILALSKKQNIEESLLLKNSKVL